MFRRHVLVTVALGAMMVATGLAVPAGATAATSSPLTVTARDLGTIDGLSAQATAINARGDVIGTLQGGRAFFWHQGVMTELQGPANSVRTPAALDDRGDVVGFIGLADGTTQATLWRNGSPINLAPQLTYPAANSINNRGQVLISASVSQHGRLYLWDRGRLTDLGTLGGNSAFPAPAGKSLNDAGQVIGYSTTAGGDEHAFRWAKGTMTDLDGVAGHDSTAAAINNRGQVVGYSYSDQPRKGYLWDGAGATTLTIPGGGDVQATGLNDRAQVIGTDDTASGSRHGFVWQKGHFTDVGSLGGDGGEANAINDRGQVVGDAQVGPFSYSVHAFLRQADDLIDLGALGGVQSEALGINERGQIVGFTQNAAGVDRAILWTVTKRS